MKSFARTVVKAATFGPVNHLATAGLVAGIFMLAGTVYLIAH